MDAVEVTRRPGMAGFEHCGRFAMVEVIKDAYDEHMAYIRSLNVDGYQEPEGVSFQFDGVTWPQDDNDHKGPLRPNELVMMPQIVAEHGIKATMVWHHRNVVDPETGE